MRLRHVGWLLAAVVVLAWSARAARASDAAATDSSKKPTTVRPETELRERLDRASAMFEQGRFDEARKEYERATKQDPGSIRAWVGLGWSHWQMGDRQQALKIWNDILKVSPGDPKIMIALAQAHEAMGAWSESLAYYDRLGKQGTVSREAHLGKARVLEQLGRYPAAEAELQQALKADPQDVNAQFALARIYLAMKRREDAERILKQLVARKPDPKYLRILGDGMLQLGRYDEAAAYYKQSLASAPDHRGTVLSLSRSYARNHRYREATEALKPYVSRHPEDDQALEELAKAAANANDVGEAQKRFQQLIEKHPDDNQWRMRLAKMFRQAGRPDDGVAIAREVAQRDPNDVDALGFLADDAQLSGKWNDAIKTLERLAAVQPVPSRLNQLGRLRLLRAEALEDSGNRNAAAADYRAAKQAFQVSAKLDPKDSDAVLGMITAERLGGNEAAAAAQAEQTIRDHPNLESMRLEAFQSYSQSGRFEDAERHLRELLEIHPHNVGLEQQLAMLDFNEGQREEGIERLQGLLKRQLSKRVPILLYHGISKAPRTPSAMPVENFRDQMVTLKQEGYQPITLAQFLDFVEGKGSLPPKPIFITFDDARSDSIENADPVLKELGFHAAMFIPAGEIGQHGAYYAPWHQLAELFQTGRWDMQCHANTGHRTIPVDAEGHEGRFFSDRMWLADQNRVETTEEFAQRLEEDYRSCKDVIEKNVPGTKVEAYAYPFGDLGQRRFTNEPNAVKINMDLVSKYYRAGFVEAPFGMASPGTDHTRFPRYEMSAESKGADVVRLLRTADPENSTLYMLAQLYAWSGRFADADAIYADLERRGYDRATLLAARAQSLQWNGDFSGARELFQQASALRPNDNNLKRKIENLDAQVAPVLQADGSYYEDNRDRSNFSIGSQGKVYLSDRLSVGAKYLHREFTHDNFNLSTLAEPSSGSSSSNEPEPTVATTPPPSTTPTTGVETTQITRLPAGTTGRAKFRAVGNQFEGTMEYQVDQRTAFSITGGVADFDDRSSPKLLDGSQTFPIVSGRVSFGLSDSSDMALGASHGYVPAAGTILDGLEYTGGQVQFRLRPAETWTFFTQGLAEAYDEDDNYRYSAVARLTKLVWRDPGIEIGYQFLFDDAKKDNPFFYTPNRFIGNEAIFSIAIGDGKPAKLDLAGTIGEGSEKDGNPEVEGSLGANLRLQFNRHFGLLVSGGRTQSARFESFETRGSLIFKF